MKKPPQHIQDVANRMGGKVAEWSERIRDGFTSGHYIIALPNGTEYGNEYWGRASTAAS